MLKSANMHITLETAAIKAPKGLHCDLMSISPKLSNSTPENPELAEEHEKTRLNIPAIKQLISEYKYQLKLVVNGPEDFDEIADLLNKLAPIDPDRVLLMPQAATRSEYIEKAPFIAETCLRAGLGFSPRLQLLLWQGSRGK
jgi:7-carboxy-7-deazaguanine synthase